MKTKLLKRHKERGNLAPFLKSRKNGSAYYELIIKTLVFITLIATAISFFSIFTVYLNLNYACRRVVREIEIAGQVSSETTALFNQLKDNTNIGDSATMTVNASYFNAADRKIQLRMITVISVTDGFLHRIIPTERALSLGCM